MKTETKAMTGPGFRRMLLVAMLVLFLEAVLAIVLIALFGDVRETGPAPGSGAEAEVDTGGGGFGIVLGLVLMPVLLGLIAAPLAAGAAALVVPAVLFGDRLAGRVGGPAVGWQLLYTAAGAGLVNGVFEIWPFRGWWGWLAAWAGLFVAALVTWRTRPGRRYPVLVFLWGLAVIVAVLAGGLIGG
ncbi:hypothetical protein SLA_4341 [Streptomyces laurentii]|uniref:Uncharacterized protein n=1 Tax=Streptomyces laurentii TaxID=39478 RepID=A0A160P1E2_STRLU|nr:hypothetical protein SLA_4341 [Streptomyces laurentii]